MEGWTQLASVKLSESSQTKLPDVPASGRLVIRTSSCVRPLPPPPSLETAVHFHRTTKALPAHRVDSLELSLNYV